MVAGQSGPGSWIWIFGEREVRIQSAYRPMPQLVFFVAKKA